MQNLPEHYRDVQPPERRLAIFRVGGHVRHGALQGCDEGFAEFRRFSAVQEAAGWPPRRNSSHQPDARARDEPDLVCILKIDRAGGVRRRGASGSEFIGVGTHGKLSASGELHLTHARRIIYGRYCCLNPPVRPWRTVHGRQVCTARFKAAHLVLQKLEQPDH